MIFNSFLVLPPLIPAKILAQNIGVGGYQAFTPHFETRRIMFLLNILNILRAKLKGVLLTVFGPNTLLVRFYMGPPLLCHTVHESC